MKDVVFLTYLYGSRRFQLCYVGRICEAFLAEVALQLSGLAMAVEQVALANVTALELTVLGNGNLFFAPLCVLILGIRFLLLSEFALYLRVGFTCPLRAPETSASGRPSSLGCFSTVLHSEHSSAKRWSRS